MPVAQSSRSASASDALGITLSSRSKRGAEGPSGASSGPCITTGTSKRRRNSARSTENAASPGTSPWTGIGHGGARERGHEPRLPRGQRPVQAEQLVRRFARDRERGEQRAELEFRQRAVQDGAPQRAGLVRIEPRGGIARPCGAPPRQSAKDGRDRMHGCVLPRDLR